MKNIVEGKHRNGHLIVWMDGRHLDIQPSLKAYNHSPSGFGAGYGGSGAAQLALAILMEVADKERAIRYHQDFKWEFLANPVYLNNDFSFAVDVQEWLAQKS